MASERVTLTLPSSELCLIPYSEISNMGLICHVDLFPVPGETSAETSSESGKAPRQESTSSPPSASMSPASYSPPGPGQYPYTFPAPQPPYHGPHGASSSAPMGMQLPPMQVPPPQPYQQPAASSYDPSEEEVVHWHNNFGVAEGSKVTEALAGTTFVQASNLDYKGNKVLMFVFSVRVNSIL